MAFGFKLSEDPQFVKEFARFSTALKQVENLDYQNQINVLLEQLKQLVAKIDVGHDADYNGMINPGALKDTRDELQQVRQSIIQKFMEMGITVK